MTDFGRKQNLNSLNGLNSWEQPTYLNVVIYTGARWGKFFIQMPSLAIDWIWALGSKRRFSTHVVWISSRQWMNSELSWGHLSFAFQTGLVFRWPWLFIRAISYRLWTLLAYFHCLLYVNALYFSVGSSDLGVIPPPFTFWEWTLRPLWCCRQGVMKVDNFEVFAVFFPRPISHLLQPMIRCLFLRVVVCLLGCGFRACGWNRLAWTLRTFSIFELRALGVVEALISVRGSLFLLGLVVLGGLFGLPSHLI